MPCRNAGGHSRIPFCGVKGVGCAGMSDSWAIVPLASLRAIIVQPIGLVAAASVPGRSDPFGVIGDKIEIGLAIFCRFRACGVGLRQFVIADQLRESRDSNAPFALEGEQVAMRGRQISPGR